MWEEAILSLNGTTAEDGHLNAAVVVRTTEHPQTYINQFDSQFSVGEMMPVNNWIRNSLRFSLQNMDDDDKLRKTSSNYVATNDSYAVCGK